MKAGKFHIGAEYTHEDHGTVVLVGITTECTDGRVDVEIDETGGIPVLMDTADSYAYFHEHADADPETASWKEPLEDFATAVNDGL